MTRSLLNTACSRRGYSQATGIHREGRGKRQWRDDIPPMLRIDPLPAKGGEMQSGGDRTSASTMCPVRAGGSELVFPLPAKGGVIAAPRADCRAPRRSVAWHATD